jgi:ribonuclease P protein component
MSDNRFLPIHRLRKTSEFQRAFHRRSTAGDDRLLVFGHPNGLPHARLGLSVSRKVGNAVRRNRWKRLLRDAFRLSREQLPCGVDLVVVPRPTATPELEALRVSLVRLANRVSRKLQSTQSPSTRIAGREPT